MEWLTLDDEKLILESKIGHLESLHISNGTSEIPNCENLVGADFFGNPYMGTVYTN